MPSFDSSTNNRRMPVSGVARTCRACPLGIHGTDPVGGGNIDVFIERQIFGFRLTIATDDVVIMIDIP